MGRRKGRGRGRGRGSGGRGNVFRREDHEEKQKNEQADELPQNKEDHHIRGVINTILGGFAGGGTTSSARKRHMRAATMIILVSYRSLQASRSITFTDDDFVGTDPNQDDPIVITVEVATFMVQKTLVDQGSSLDILY